MPQVVAALVRDGAVIIRNAVPAKTCEVNPDPNTNPNPNPNLNPNPNPNPNPVSAEALAVMGKP